MSNAAKPVSKPGKYGTLYLFEIAYRDTPVPNEVNFTTRLWAYDIEHAVQKSVSCTAPSSTAC